VVVSLDGTDEAEPAFADQVGERHAAAGEPLADRDDQCQVGLQQAITGPGTVLCCLFQVGARLAG
jgi:hypothetical protein